MRRASVLLVFLSALAIIAILAVGFGWFSENKPDHPEIIPPVTQWKAKRAFLDSCLKSNLTVDSAKANGNRELQLCNCLADKVEEKYPQGLSYQEASKAETLKEIGADFCYQ